MSGDDPQLVADLIVNVANQENPEFRYPAGQQAEEFLSGLKQNGCRLNGMKLFEPQQR